jgi:hypothetical protein
MSDPTIRATALAHALVVAAKGSVEEVLAAAVQFEHFIVNGLSMGHPATAPKAAAPAAAPKAAAPKAAPAAAPKAADPAEMKKAVGDKVNALLKASKRDEAISLLGSFNGAKSASGIVDQGEAIVKKFIAGADKILAAAEAEAGLSE